jgi:hypothetical protein
MTTEKQGPDPTALSQALNWWQEARKQWNRLFEFSNLDPHELERMAADAGLSSDELVYLSKQANGVPLLIEKRLAALNLHPDDVRKLSPLLLRDLERTCALCSEKGRCADDMAVDPLAPGWESYCPNSGTVRTLT